MSPSGLFVQSVRLIPEKVADPDAYPFAIPAVRALAGERDFLAERERYLARLFADE